MEYGALMEMAVRAGEIMLASGAEVYRVEDTIHRILKHSGIARADVFVVTTGIVATIADASLPPLTLVKRVENRATNLNRIYQVNNVSREFCSLDVVIISAIMPLVPGVTFTAAIRDTLNGDYSSGVARMAEAVVVALAVASGVGLAIVAVRLAGGSV